MAAATKTGGEKRISVVVPNYNGGETIGPCLAALFASDHDSFEVIVVDDCSSDNSRAIIKKYPCRLVELHSRSGAATARNLGAYASQGEIIFFTDGDCLVRPDTLRVAEAAAKKHGPRIIIGGTYTPVPFDRGFFSLFQSVFINYSELKKMDRPDYIATHAMAIHAKTFRTAGGFAEDFLPILEDVEFSHRLLRAGYQLQMAGGLLVAHVFNYDLSKSLRNAYHKAKFWVVYSLANRDLFKDSGTASFEMKTNVTIFYLLLLLFCTWVLLPGIILPQSLPLLFAGNLVVSRRLMTRFCRTGGPFFALLAVGYYLLVYPLAVGAGTFSGLCQKQKLSFAKTTPGNL